MASTSSATGSTTSASETMTTMAAGAISQLVDSQFTVFTYRPVAPPWEYVLRITLCFLMMLAVGVERQAQRKPLGFGPFSMVGVGSCSAAILAIIVSPTAPLVLMSGTVSSIGFLVRSVALVLFSVALVCTPQKINPFVC